MIGINIETLESLIKKNNNNLNSYNTDSKRLVDCISELSNCYSGRDLEYLFMEPTNQISSMHTILKVIENYSDILLSVRKGYEQQDLKLQARLNHINSDFK